MPAHPQTPEHPSFEEQAAFYDRWNPSYRTSGFAAIEPESKARGTRVLQVLGALGLERPSILEVGCGTGWLTEQLVQFGAVTAIDLSGKAIEIARGRGLGAEFIAGNFYTQDLPAGHFDVAVCVETVAYVPDQPRFIDKIASLLKPGGHLILTAVNPFVYNRRTDVQPLEPGQIRKWLTRGQLHRLLGGRFRILKSTTLHPVDGRGVLRLVNSHKVNRLLGCVLPERAITSMKEALGFGHCRVVLARRRDG
jgi:2-polyprenyl-3-methyl-5-hydroxy-6-metoxy-1,4-benzoquinol methylase